MEGKLDGSELKELLQKLDDLEIGHIKEKPTFQVESIDKEIDGFLTEKAKEMFSKQKVNSLTSFKNDGSVEWTVRYFGVRTYLKSVGVLKLAEIANEVAENFNVVGVLTGPSQVDLVSESLNHTQDTASIFFIAVNPSDAIKMEKYRFKINKGETPQLSLETPEEIEKAHNSGLIKMDKNLETISDGEIKYKFRVSHILTRPNNKSNDEIIHEEVVRVLSMLPKGTTYVKTVKLPVVNLFNEYVITFHNEIFQTGAELKDMLDYRREISVSKSGETKHFNISNAFNFNDIIRTTDPKTNEYVTLGEIHKKHE